MWFNPSNNMPMTWSSRMWTTLLSIPWTHWILWSTYLRQGFVNFWMLTVKFHLSRYDMSAVLLWRHHLHTTICGPIQYFSTRSIVSLLHCIIISISIALILSNTEYHIYNDEITYACDMSKNVCDEYYTWLQILNPCYSNNMELCYPYGSPSHILLWSCLISGNGCNTDLLPFLY
jgi:hypothetical protein